MDIKLGEKLRKIRKEKGMSIAALAEKAGVSPGMISQIERNTTVPSILLFAKIAKALDENISYFLDEEQPRERVSLIRAGAHRVVSGTGNEYHLLTPNPDRQIEMYKVIFKKSRDDHGCLAVHEGAECGFLLSGRLRILTSEGDYEMLPGDSIYFESTLPHRIVNINEDDSDCVAIWAQTPFTW